MKQFLRTFEDILDYAIEQEVQANSFYNHLAADVHESELRQTLEEFAAQEFQHKMHLEGVRDGQVKLTPEEVGSLDIAKHLKPIGLREDMSYPELLEFAIQKEAHAEQLYRKLASITKRPEVKKIFLLLAQEEAQHKLNLEIEYDLTTF